MHQTLYEIGVLPNFEFWFSLGFAAVGLVVLAIAIERRRRRASASRGFAYVWSIGAIGLGGAAAIVIAGRHVEAYRAYSEGRCQVVEGKVHLEHIQPSAGHSAGDLVRVGGHAFEIDFFSSRPGYTRTVAHGGALRDGTSVRLWYYGRDVLRIDGVPNSPPNRPVGGE